MSEDKELSNLEVEWKNKFDRFTAPIPTSEETYSLIQKIKAMDEQKPVDLRAELEETQDNQSVYLKVMDMFASQWNLHGSRSWMLTGMVMLLLTITINLNMAGDVINGFTTWIKWITFIIIAVISYAFRTRNEGNQIIEKLSYYPIIQQMFIRFMIIMGIQLAITLPLSLFILGKESSFLYLVSTFTPIFFFGVFGFISTIWLGQKLGAILSVFVWFSQVLFNKQLKFVSLFQVPGNDHFILINVIAIGISILLLSSILLKSHSVKNI